MLQELGLGKEERVSVDGRYSGAREREWDQSRTLQPAGRRRYSASRANEGKTRLARLNAPLGGTPRRAWRALRRGGGREREALGDGDEGKDVGRSASNYYTR